MSEKNTNTNEDSDIEFEDDDEILNKRKEELMKQAEGKRELTDDEAFRADFDPKSSTFHKGLKTVVPLGGARVPEGMKDHANWRDLPEAPVESVKPDAYGPEYEKLHYEREELNNFKKSVAAVLPTVAALIQLKSVEDEKSARVATLTAQRDEAIKVLQGLMLKYPADSHEYGAALADVVQRASKNDITKEEQQQLIEHAKRLTAKVFNKQNSLLQLMKKAKTEYLKNNKA